MRRPRSAARVHTAAVFFETRFRGKQFTEVTEYLKGIDFSQEVRQVKLVAEAPWQSTLVQYVAGDRPGNFFSKSGYPADRLGIALGVRRLRRFRVTNAGVDVLVCTAAPVSDTWTPGRTRDVYSPVQAPWPWQAPQRAGELTGGGGLQIIVPDPVTAYLEPVSDIRVADPGGDCAVYPDKPWLCRLDSAGRRRPAAAATDRQRTTRASLRVPVGVAQRESGDRDR